MELKVIGTGSSGNAYIISDAYSDLILDAGMPIKDIKQALNYNVTRIKGVLISHVHKDHTRALKDLLNLGAMAYMNASVKESYDQYNARSVKPFEAFGLDRYISCFAFEVPHDNVDCYAYFIKWGDVKRILYMTDLEYCPTDISGLKPTDIIVECNYCEDMVDENAENIRHKLLGHMGLKTCKDFLGRMKHDDLQNVFLCHRGLDTSDPEEMQKAISEILPNTNVYVCKKDLTVKI